MATNVLGRLLVIPLAMAVIAALCANCPCEQTSSYMLLEGSTLTEDCIICGRPPIIVPLRGTFQLVPFEPWRPDAYHNHIRDVHFQTLSVAFPYVIAGEGAYERSGEFYHSMNLNVRINDAIDAELSSGAPPPQRKWPTIEIIVSQEPVDPLRVFSIHLVAAPVREIWFSTANGFTSGATFKAVSAGDILSCTGHVVRANLDLTSRLGIMPLVPDLGLDALDILPGGEIIFSCEERAFSETLGQLQHGDLLSEQGRIVRTNQELTSPFSPMPPLPDVGLDAIQVMDNGEILFSIEENLFSQALGVTLSPGDLLSDRGVVVRTNRELLSNFNIIGPGDDFGLDAIHVWPNGEIWFSTEAGFQADGIGTVSDGDLLSDNGSVIFRNLALVEPFGPVEDVDNFGLDALYLVTEGDLKQPDVERVRILVDSESGDVMIDWLTNARVSQVERADEPGGPFVPLGSISPNIEFIDLEAALSKNKRFYRVRLW